MHLRLVTPTPSEIATTSVDPLAALSVAARDGDVQAVQTLLVSVTPAMLRAIRGVIGARHPDVQDVLQESALGLVGALGSFRHECSVLHFACRVAVLKALAARRRLRARDNEAEWTEDPDLADGSSPDETVDSAKRRAVLRELCDVLPEPQTEALVLHCVLGYTVEEVASTTGVPANTVRSRLRLAKEALRNRILSDPGLREALEAKP
jgi:RNA polymerase sigma factor (sigma-70 family)